MKQTVQLLVGCSASCLPACICDFFDALFLGVRPAFDNFAHVRYSYYLCAYIRTQAGSRGIGLAVHK